jgi:hypothetical protein
MGEEGTTPATRVDVVGSVSSVDFDSGLERRRGKKKKKKEPQGQVHMPRYPTCSHFFAFTLFFFAHHCVLVLFDYFLISRYT